MGPRSFNRGNLPDVLQNVPGALLQWGRGLSTAEMSKTTPERRCHLELQWGRGLSTAEMWTAGTQPRSWKNWLQWGRGLSTAEMQAFVGNLFGWKRLQWGRGLSTAEIRRALQIVPATNQLQWGRGLSTAEMPGLRATALIYFQASMGPRSFNRGNVDDGSSGSVGT